MSPFIAAHARNQNWHTALTVCLEQLTREARRAAHGKAVAEYTLGWCYLTDAFAGDAEDILAELKQHLPGVSWVGTVGIGVAASATEYIDEPALALMLAPLPRASFRLFSGRQPLSTKADAGDFHAHTALVHADAAAPDLQELLPELAQRTATGYLFGGLSSARTQALQIADAVLTGGLSGVAFSDEVGVISRVTQGCQPVGPVRQVTRAEGNMVLTLNGQPALACALHDLALASDLAVEDMAEALSSTLVGLSRGGDDQAAPPGRFGADTLVRHIVGLDPRARVLAIGDEVSAGSQLTFCRRNPEAALEDVRRMAAEIRDELDASKQAIAGAIYVSCVGRGGPHFGAPDAELLAIHDTLGDVPLVGFFANGEIARDRLYGYTGVLTVFTLPA